MYNTQYRDVLKCALSEMKYANIKKSINEIMLIFNTYLCFHGFTRIIKFQISLRNIFSFTFSTVFMIIIGINNIYSLFARFEYLLRSKNTNRDAIVITIIMVLEYLLQILFFLKRNELKQLTQCMANIYPAVASKRIFRFKRNIILVLLTNDIYILSVIFAYFSAFSFLYDNNGVYGFLQPPLSGPVFYISIVMDMWAHVTPFITIYFCCFCFAFKKIILGLKEKFSKKDAVNFDNMNKAYNDVLTFNSTFNKTFHNMLLVVFVILSGRLFYSTYNLVFKKSLMVSHIIFRLLNIFNYFCRLILICTFASSLSKVASEFRNFVHDIPVKEKESWKYLRLIIKMNENFIGFKLLDSVTLDKSLIVVATGSLITYGIMIATFNVSS